MELPITQDQRNMPSLREVANGEDTLRVPVLFSLTAWCKKRLGQFIESTSKFVSGFQALTLAFDLTWKDVQIVLIIMLSLALRKYGEFGQ